MHAVRLAYEVLDAQLIDAREDKIGRVDDVVLELRAGAAPRVSAILIGGPARAERTGRWMRALHRVLRRVLHIPDGTSRIPFDKVRMIAEVVQVDVKGDELEAMRFERWLAEHVVRHVPGADSKLDRKVGIP